MHRDRGPNPRNVLVDARGRAYVADFGAAATSPRFDDVAKLGTRAQRRAALGTTLAWPGASGTFPFMSPRVVAEFALAVRARGAAFERGAYLAPVTEGADADGAFVGDLAPVNRPGADGGATRPLGIFAAADSYAFGVLMWQVLTLRSAWSFVTDAGGGDDGDDPLVSKVVALWRRVQAGHRPPVTAADLGGAPEGYAALMRELWAQDPVVRPTFAEALRRLRGMSAPPTRAASTVDTGTKDTAAGG